MYGIGVEMKIEEINPLVLAYLGDSVYEVYIRLFLVEKKIPTIKDLQKESLQYVSAKQQAKFLRALQNSSFFQEEEEEILRRARNTKGHKAPKNCDIITYKQATALEAIIGYWYLLHKTDRIKQVMEKIWEMEEC